jgi:hypothetical protein
VGNLARKIIDAVQHSMLDRLLLAAFPLLTLATWWDDLWESPTDLTLWLLVGLPAVFVVAWLVGVVANHARPHRGSDPMDGFAAWSLMPPEQLNPPGWIRTIVFALTFPRSSASWWALLSMAVFMGAFCLMLILSKEPLPEWAYVHPAMADPAVVDRVWFISAGLVVATVVQSWAFEQRRRLDPPRQTDQPERSRWFDLAFLTIVLVPLGLVLSAAFGGLKWIMAIVAVIILTAAVAPLWRRRGFDFLFGKRDSASDGR